MTINYVIEPWSLKMMNREFTYVSVSGGGKEFFIPFYKSSGTNAGKIKDKWYPCLGFLSSSTDIRVLNAYAKINNCDVDGLFEKYGRMWIIKLPFSNFFGIEGTMPCNLLMEISDKLSRHEFTKVITRPAIQGFNSMLTKYNNDLDIYLYDILRLPR